MYFLFFSVVKILLDPTEFFPQIYKCIWVPIFLAPYIFPDTHCLCGYIVLIRLFNAHSVQSCVLAVLFRTLEYAYVYFDLHPVSDL